MKLARIVCCAVVFGCVMLGALSAQDEQSSGAAFGKSDLYVAQVPIEKIYPHNKGYVVEYRKNGLGTRQIFIPIEWFSRRVGQETPLKCQVVQLDAGKVWPHVSLYYRNGVVDHIKLYVRRSLLHQTWGRYINDNTPGADENFLNVENIKLRR